MSTPSERDTGYGSSLSSDMTASVGQADNFSTPSEMSYTGQSEYGFGVTPHGSYQDNHYNPENQYNQFPKQQTPSMGYNVGPNVTYGTPAQPTPPFNIQTPGGSEQTPFSGYNPYDHQPQHTPQYGNNEYEEPEVQPEVKFKSPETETRSMSLESRIQSLLQSRERQYSTSSQDSSDESHSVSKEKSVAPDMPPLPEENPPPLPSEEAPPPPESEPPPLPPMPPPPTDDHLHTTERLNGNSQTEFICDNEYSERTTVMIDNGQYQYTQGQLNQGEVVEATYYYDNGEYLPVQQVHNGQNEDDKMSLSSLSSGEEKLEVNPNITVETDIVYDSTISQSGDMSYTGDNSFHNRSRDFNSSFEEGHLMTPQEIEMVLQDDPNEKTYDDVLDQIMEELKYIMKKDLNKRMVQNSGFKCFEGWWDQKQQVCVVNECFQIFFALKFLFHVYMFSENN